MELNDVPGSQLGSSIFLGCTSKSTFGRTIGPRTFEASLVSLGGDLCSVNWRAPVTLGASRKVNIELRKFVSQ